MEILADCWLAVLFFLILILLAISIFTFGRSVRFIEKEMGKKNLAPPSWDAGYGVRYFMYAFAIVIGQLHFNPLVDTDSIIKYARKVDCFRARLLAVTSILFLVLIGVIYFVEH
jgi:preprotein translocase subunit SecG